MFVTDTQLMGTFFDWNDKNRLDFLKFLFKEWKGLIKIFPIDWQNTRGVVYGQQFDGGQGVERGVNHTKPYHTKPIVGGTRGQPGTWGAKEFKPPYFL